PTASSHPSRLLRLGEPALRCCADSAVRCLTVLSSTQAAPQRFPAAILHRPTGGSSGAAGPARTASTGWRPARATSLPFLRVPRVCSEKSVCRPRAWAAPPPSTKEPAMDVQLLFALVLGITTIIVLVLATRLDAFVALLIAGIVTGVVADSGFVETINWITEGFGSTLASVGIVIGLGVFIGKILEVSGAADALARAFLRLFGKGREPWAMASVGSLVSIPVFCDSGYVIMHPLARSI